MPITTPRLLRNEHGVFYFRIILPQDLARRFGRRSIKRSLHTKDPRLARIIALRVNNYFETMRAKHGTQGMSDMHQAAHRSRIDPDGHRFDINTPQDEIAYLRIRQREAALRASPSVTLAAPGALGGLPMAGVPLQPSPATLPAADEDQEGLAAGLAPGLRLQELRPPYEAWLASDAPKDRKAKLQTFDHFHAYLVRSRAQAIEQNMQVAATPPSVHLHSIRPAELVGFFDDYAKRTSRRGGEGLSEATLSAVKARLKHFYEFCISEGFLTANPVESREVRINRTATPYVQVPICDQLVELGFIDYLEHLRSLGATRLFPHRKEIRREEGKQTSKRVGEDFSGYLHSRGFRISIETTDPHAPHRKQTVEVKDPQKTFHSFRHTVFTALHVNAVTLADAEMIAGHNDQSIAIQQSLSREFQVTLSKSTQQEYVNAGVESRSPDEGDRSAEGPSRRKTALPFCGRTVASMRPGGQQPPGARPRRAAVHQRLARQ